MNEDLVEALAKRLAEVCSGVRSAPEWHDRAARECIRQMEFARRCVGVSGPMTYEGTELRMGEIVPVTKIVSPARAYLPDLALAPDDWRLADQPLRSEFGEAET